MSAAATGHNSVTTANSSLQVVSGTSAPLATEPPPGPRVRACSAAESLRNPVQQTEPRQCSHPQPGRCGGALVVMGIPSRPGSCWVRASVQPTTPTPMSMRRRHGGAVFAKALRWNFSRPSVAGASTPRTPSGRAVRVHPAVDHYLAGADPWPPPPRAAVRRLVDGTLTGSASEHRQRIRNREAARMRMAGLLRAAVGPPGPARRPSAGARQRRLDTGRRRSETKRGRGRPAD